MWLFVGLGNVGEKYVATRHNVGFGVVDRLAEREGASFAGSTRLQAITATTTLSGPEGEREKIVLAKPTTLMNLSGNAVRRLCDFYDVPLDRVCVVCDDFNLPLGALRLRAKGSHGGQNGLRHIIALFGSQDFARLRLGIGPVPGRTDPAAFVLSRFKEHERDDLLLMLDRGCDALYSLVSVGLEHTQERYNGPLPEA